MGSWHYVHGFSAHGPSTIYDSHENVFNDVRGSVTLLLLYHGCWTAVDRVQKLRRFINQQPSHIHPGKQNIWEKFAYQKDNIV